MVLQSKHNLHIMKGKLERVFGAAVKRLLFRGFPPLTPLTFFGPSNLLTYLKKYRRRPLLSVLVPVYNTNENILKKCLDSVLRQTYDRWELCIVDDASTDEGVRRILLAAARQDPRIKLEFAKENGGIAATINRAARLASGAFIGVLDHDDELAHEALIEYARWIVEHPEADVIYCDEDKIDDKGRHCDPWYKSDWNPDLLLSFNYVMHFVMYRRRLFQQVGGVRPAYEGSQDYDLMLRVAEKTRRIDHIPRIFYHWRMGKGSIASGPEAKPGVFVSGLAALDDALKRRNIKGRAEDAPDTWKGVYRVRRSIDAHLSCSFIISADGHGRGLERLYGSLEKQIRWDIDEMVICYRHSDGPTDFGSSDLPIRWLDTGNRTQPQRFNLAAGLAHKDLLLFLNDTFECRSPDSVMALIEQGQRSEVGAAGGKVYYGNGLLEHGGVILGPFGLLGYSHRATRDDHGYAGIKNMIGNFSAVMGLGMMTRRSVFNRLGGFDTMFVRSYWDVDYCLRAGARQLLVTYTPYAAFTHHVRVPSIDEMIVEPDASRFKARWQALIDHDPYFNPNFSRSLECFLPSTL